MGGLGTVLAAFRAPGSDLDGSGRLLGALRSALGDLGEARGGLLSSLGGLWATWGHLGDPWGATKASGALLESSWEPLGSI